MATDSRQDVSDSERERGSDDDDEDDMDEVSLLRSQTLDDSFLSILLQDFAVYIGLQVIGIFQVF